MNGSLESRGPVPRAPSLALLSLLLIGLVLVIHVWSVLGAALQWYAIDPSVALPALFLIAPIAAFCAFASLLVFLVRRGPRPA